MLPFSWEDLKQLTQLRGSLLRCLALVALGLLAVAASLHRHGAVKALHRQAFATQAALQAATRAALSHQSGNAPTPTDLTRLSAITAPEDRAVWGKSVAEALARHKVSASAVEWSPRQHLGQGHGFALAATALTLRLKPLHEEDLLHLLIELQDNGQALVLPRRCMLQRPAASSGQSSGTLLAECRLDWITATELP